MNGDRKCQPEGKRIKPVLERRHVLDLKGSGSTTNINCFAAGYVLAEISRDVNEDVNSERTQLENTRTRTPV
jgi:hypothetical protein